MIGTGAVLLLLSAAGLTLLAQHAREQTNVAVMLLTLHLAAWSYVLGMAGLILVPVLEFIDWLRLPVKPGSISRYPTVEQKCRDLERPEKVGIPSRRRDGIPIAVSRVSQQSKNRHKAASSTKVA